MQTHQTNRHIKHPTSLSDNPFITSLPIPICSSSFSLAPLIKEAGMQNHFSRNLSIIRIITMVTSTQWFLRSELLSVQLSASALYGCGDDHDDTGGNDDEDAEEFCSWTQQHLSEKPENWDQFRENRFSLEIIVTLDRDIGSRDEPSINRIIEEKGRDSWSFEEWKGVQPWRMISL